jgi:glutamate N-acetyltransferase/amino-acid N-acetyltransferase
MRAGIRGPHVERSDLALIVFDAPQACASLITTNEVKAAPLTITEEHLARSGASMRAVVCNSGCANACTGKHGEDDVRATAGAAAELLRVESGEIVIASTGVIGVPLPMERLTAGLADAASALDAGTRANDAAARAIMTTDRVPKSAAYEFVEQGRRYVVGGIAKGSGMIAPHLATMLAFVATDFPLSRPALQAALRDACDDSFNMISVDGDMSTNDAVYAFAPSGAGEASAACAAAIKLVCRDLALAMARDGEGATKLLTVEVTGARDRAQARAVARKIVDSSLVKTAVHGGDPNWGRITAAAGAAGTGLVPESLSLFINGKAWVDRNARELLSEPEAHREMEQPQITIRLDLGIASASAAAWGCDLSPEYVAINAHYRT